MKTMLQKVWEQHEVVAGDRRHAGGAVYRPAPDPRGHHPAGLHAAAPAGPDRRRPDLTIATIDHSSPTRTEQIFGGVPFTIESAARQIAQLQRNCADFGIELLDLKSDQRGIVHIIGPELGLTLPGSTLVCGDSHTSTHGAFGALAFGIGTTEVGHVFATQCLLQRSPRPSRSASRARCRPASPPRI